MTTVDECRRALLKGLPALGLAMAVAAPTSSTAKAQRATPARLRKVGLEEHFMLPDFVGYLRETQQNLKAGLVDEILPVLSDFGERRLSVMDSNGVDFVVLSLAGPGVQIEPDARTAERLARSGNDALAKEVQKRPERYGGFAHLALQNPNGAANELERYMRDLGFKGALINGETNGVYLDDRRFDVFWERAAALQAPIYIHPGNPPDYPHMYVDHPELWGPTWSWAAETCSHALRLVFSGTFERYPDARVILGHMGETLPIQLWRLDSRFPISNQRYPLKKNPSDYIRQSVRITTSGVCSDAALRCALDAMGQENVMFSIDYPFEDTKVAADWIASARISDTERVNVAYENAKAILRL